MCTERKKSDILNKLLNLISYEKKRNLTDDELLLKTKLAIEVEDMAKFEEVAWR